MTMFVVARLRQDSWGEIIIEPKPQATTILAVNQAQYN
jgi:hypothetical protein